MRAIWRLLRLLVHVAGGLWTIHVRFGSLDRAGRLAAIQAWSSRTLVLLGVELKCSGLPRPGAKLLLANHVSWLDIAAVHAVMPEARFVAKAGIKHWPLVGALVEAAGTLFIERSSKRDALRVVHQTAEALKNGDTVAVFPEGTTGPGPELLPFHANLLQAAIATETPIQPMMLRWHEPGQRFSTSARFIGDMTLLQSVWSIVSARGLGCELRILLPMESAHADRRALSEHVRELIAEELAR
ncbi:lysophospholipid acyltransferase family protein [Pelomonas sp. SE-A7]|uniref:lysophospholipid acyltransferase family protein n=1 Tax=Pelomonas sp. SE-A7 TaxID=3054953 RepID=UPI00259CD774|nr:lysophospholipid acyltransferase family protein [Pelomonas sp. SE-A7]MDM4767605.1 lysophospholipid acyltransferase family protein [Pelomonas sp. SE-A7]